MTPVRSQGDAPSSDALDWWFARLHRLNDVERAAARRRARGPGQRRTQRMFVAAVLAPAALSIVLGAAALALDDRVLADASLIALALCYLGIPACFLGALWRHRHSAQRRMFNPFATLLDNTRTTAAVDRRQLAAFAARPRSELRFVAMELRAERHFFARRIGLVVGAIERVGLLPGVLAIAVLLHRLGDAQPAWIYAVAYATPILYLMAVFSHLQLMRLDRMVRLLDLLVTDETSSDPGCAAASRG